MPERGNKTTRVVSIKRLICFCITKNSFLAEPNWENGESLFVLSLVPDEDIRVWLGGYTMDAISTRYWKYR